MQRPHGHRIDSVVAIVVLVAGSMVSARQTRPADGAIRLIVQGDDMAAAHGINVGTLEAFTHGIVPANGSIAVGSRWLQR
jgi:hypothetical protein